MLACRQQRACGDFELMPTGFQFGSREDIPTWPEWLEVARISDSLAASAYEATPPNWRTALKTGLALTMFHFGESASMREESLVNARLGFGRAVRRFPAPWAFIVFSPRYAAAARLTAACAAAILAAVPQVAALCVGGAPQASALVSLELSGVEDIFQLEAKSCAALLEELAQGHGEQGRVVLLHEGELADMSLNVRSLAVPCYEEQQPPRLCIDKDAGIDRQILAFAHGGEAALQAALAAEGRPNAVFCAPADRLSPAPEAMLALCHGCEAFWLHPGLTPDFFTVCQQIFAPWPPLPDPAF